MNLLHFVCTAFGWYIHSILNMPWQLIFAGNDSTRSLCQEPNCKPDLRTMLAIILLSHMMATTMVITVALHRCYTVAITTAAALLVAAVVWAPNAKATAAQDSTWGDVQIIPRKLYRLEDGSPDPDPAPFAGMLYYSKIMALSVLVGHTVKLALLANLSPPDPGSKGVAVPKAVWRRQRLTSIWGLLLLVALVASYFLAVFWQQHMLELMAAHW